MTRGYESRKGDRLSAAELKVAKLMADDLADKQIAAALGLSQKTVEAHAYALRKKIGARSKIGVAVWYATEGKAYVPKRPALKQPPHYGTIGTHEHS